ncbi:unnamed protein product [Anisakis simplex]|uniref:Thrombospondin type-1 domain-containing protein 4-like n=1 Tax=Anisakis simplex TaxID=6269 RepID=A0A0M3JXR4_ANISI|nr:unnamed protein product [Anisakis simplex]
MIEVTISVIKSEISQLDTVCVTCVTQKPCATCVPQDEWGPWGPWSDCTFKYGLYSQTRQRVCTSGPGKCTGGNGGGEEAIRCSPPATTTLQPLPQWSQWGPWGQCSKLAATGTHGVSGANALSPVALDLNYEQEHAPVISTNYVSRCMLEILGVSFHRENLYGLILVKKHSKNSDSVRNGREDVRFQCAEGEGIEQRACEMSSCVTCDTCASVTTPSPCGINNPCPTLQPCNNCQNPPTIPTIPVVKTVERSSSSSNTNFIPVIGSSQNTNIINSEYNTSELIFRNENFKNKTVVVNSTQFGVH